ncbi:hypothetical protein [Actinoplanes sp. G11-F43]|uniref:hypothetical protein n=1 Tax=Actinoplanes sp. G11-F43 TaxID=3424130 RepID=UPI003D328534
MDAPYGLTRPTFDDAREAVHRVHGDDGPRIWQHLVKAAGLSGHEPDAVDRLLSLMETADPTTRLCATALRIRVTSYDCLAVAHHDLRSAI